MFLNSLLACILAVNTAATQPSREAVMMHDGTNINLTVLSPEGGARARIILLHGIGYHAEPYVRAAESLTSRGIELVGIDLRGHGFSSGKRGFFAPLAEHVSDVRFVIALFARRDPATPQYLLGESMGGVIALAAAADSVPLDGLILSAPALSANPRLWFGPKLLGIAFVALLQRNRPVIDIMAEQLARSTRDTAFAAMRLADPIAQNKVTPQYLLEFLAASSRWKRDFAPRVTIPILAFVGSRDAIVDVASVRELGARAAGPARVETIDGAYHTLFWDPETPRMLDEIAAWIESKSRR